MAVARVHKEWPSQMLEGRIAGALLALRLPLHGLRSLDSLQDHKWGAMIAQEAISCWEKAVNASTRPPSMQEKRCQTWSAQHAVVWST